MNSLRAIPVLFTPRIVTSTRCDCRIFMTNVNNPLSDVVRRFWKCMILLGTWNSLF